MVKQLQDTEIFLLQSKGSCSMSDQRLNNVNLNPECICLKLHSSGAQTVAWFCLSVNTVCDPLSPLTVFLSLQ